jgi:hypothetical protein
MQNPPWPASDEGRCSGRAISSICNGVGRMIDFNIVLYAVIFAFIAVWQRSSGFCFFMTVFAGLAGIGSYTMSDGEVPARAFYLFGIAIGFVAIGLILRKIRSE